MARVTLDLLRRRAEHNDGVLHTLEEVALHQCELERVEVIQDVCRALKIVLLQGNAISKIGACARACARVVCVFERQRDEYLCSRLLILD